MSIIDKLMAEEPVWDVPAEPRRGLEPTGGAEPQFAERCHKCHGTGRFRNYGACYTCKGRGQRTFKTSPEARAKAREGAAARKDKAATAWAEANPQAWLWIVRTAPRFAFAQSMMNAVTQYGVLTERQLETVERLMAQDAERQAARAVERQQRAAAAPEVSVAAIETAFATAHENGVNSPKLRLDTFLVYEAKPGSKNAGAIYVKEGQQYLGKIMGGRFMRVRECDEATEARIVAVCADPHAAAVAYGKKGLEQGAGQCSCCGKRLTNKISKELGIGPICRAKYGWG
jgi:hypothetical protein